MFNLNRTVVLGLISTQGLSETIYKAARFLGVEIRSLYRYFWSEYRVITSFRQSIYLAQGLLTFKSPWKGQDYGFLFSKLALVWASDWHPGSWHGHSRVKSFTQRLLFPCLPDTLFDLRAVFLKVWFLDSAGSSSSLTGRNLFEMHILRFHPHYWIRNLEDGLTQQAVL